MLNKANVEKDAMTRYLYLMIKVSIVSSQGVRDKRYTRMPYLASPQIYIGVYVYIHIGIVQLYAAMVVWHIGG